MLDRYLALEGHAQSLADAVEASLTLAIRFNVLMPVFSAFAERFPHVDLEVRHPLHGDVSVLVRPRARRSWASASRSPATRASWRSYEDGQAGDGARRGAHGIRSRPCPR